MKCVRCHDIDLVDGAALTAASCPRCGGGLVPETGLVTLLEELKHTLAELKELAGHYGGERLPCPSCRSKMSPLVFRGEKVDLCFGCGSLWVGKGELESISQGRHALPAPTSPPPVKAQQQALAPAQALVRVDERSLARHLGRAALAGAGAVGVIWSIVGIVPGTSMLLGVAALGVAAGLSRRRAFDVLPRARRMVRWRGWFAPDPKEEDGVAFSPDSCVVVRDARVAGKKTPFVVIDLVDAEGRDLVCLRGPLLALRAWTEAPRYARALGVSVRFDVDPRADDELDAAEQQRAGPAFAGHDMLRIDPDPAAKKTRKLLVKAGIGAPLAEVSSEIAARGRPRTLDELLAEHFAIIPGSSPGSSPSIIPGSSPGSSPSIIPGSSPGSSPSIIPGSSPGSSPSSVDGSESVRMFSTHQLGKRATVLVGKDGRILGHIDVARSILGDTITFRGPQARRSASVTFRHGARDARVVDGHARGAGVLELGPATPGEPRPVTLHLFPGRLTGDARWGMLALAVHASLVAIVDAV